jgi:flap endonuclease-1
MGVNLGDLVSKTTIDLNNLGTKKVAIDAYNALYQFLAIIRQPDGTPLKDHTGMITSHLSGLFYRTCNLIEKGIKAVYVFDGMAPALKEAEIKRRTKVKEEAQKRYENALADGKIEEARTYAQMTSRLKDYMADDSKRLLKYMGVPWVQAPSEGEAQAAYLSKKGDTDYCASQDFDSLLFGTPLLLRNLTISGRRKLPRKKVYIEVVPEIVEMRRLLNELDITYEQLVDIGILIGTDFNPDGVKGIGPKTAYKLIKKHGTIEGALLEIKEAEFPTEPRLIKEIFLRPRVTNNYVLSWGNVDTGEVVNFLCNEKDFSENRVRKALERAIQGMKEAKTKKTLEAWF